jgi:hypothetical protein
MESTGRVPEEYRKSTGRAPEEYYETKEAGFTVLICRGKIIDSPRHSH